MGSGKWFGFILLTMPSACGNAGQHEAVETAASVEGERLANVSTLTAAPDACQELQRSIDVAHGEALATPEWQALLHSRAWETLAQALNNFMTCSSHEHTLDGPTAPSCDAQQDAVRLAWDDVAGSEEYAAATATPEAAQIDSYTAAGAELGCWGGESEKPVEAQGC